MGTEFQFREMKNVLEIDGDDCTTMCMYLMPLNCILKNSKFKKKQIGSNET